MLVVGLTGGIACGKSTVSQQLALEGLPIVDADVIAREVVEPGKKAYNQVVEAFSPDVPDLVNQDKSLNRAALGKAVFGRKDRLSVLNKIVHGAVKKEMAWQLLRLYVTGHDMVILDVPLLFEAGLHNICGATITVSTERAIQVKRLLLRNPELSEEDAEKRIDSQLPLKERNFRADKVIENNGSLEELQGQVTTAIAELKPLRVWSVLDLFPPFGILSAIVTVSYRAVRDHYKLLAWKKEN